MSLMAAHGEITPMPDCAIFADTGAEPLAVYEHLDWLETALPFPVYRVSAGNLRDEIVGAMTGSNRMDARPPFFVRNVKPIGTVVPVYHWGDDGELVQIGERILEKDEYKNSGMLHRQCTQDYKILPIIKKVRELIGLKKGQRGPKEPVVEQWIGISCDEAMRMKPSRLSYISHRWPLIERGYHRGHCLEWCEHHHYPKPAKSACTFCPYTDNARWRDMKANDPVSFADAVAIDRIIRPGMPGPKRPSGNSWWVHRDCVPLDEVDLSTAEDHGQLNLFINECEGMCGV
jgi:hypothetical protein